MFESINIVHLIIFAGLALVILGPEKFPQYARIALKAFRDFRSYVDTLKEEVEREVNPLKKEMRDLSRFKAEDVLESIANQIDDDLKSIGKDVESSLNATDTAKTPEVASETATEEAKPSEPATSSPEPATESAPHEEPYQDPYGEYHEPAATSAPAVEPAPVPPAESTPATAPEASPTPASEPTPTREEPYTD